MRIADRLYLMLHRNSKVFLGTVSVSVGYWLCMGTAVGWFGWRALNFASPPVAVCLTAVLAGLTDNAIGQAQGSVVDFIGLGPFTGERWLVANVTDLALMAGGLALGPFLLSERVRRARLPC